MVALRSINRQKMYSALNISGLAAFTAVRRTREVDIKK
jgi:hypothetical protein